MFHKWPSKKMQSYNSLINFRGFSLFVLWIRKIYVDSWPGVQLHVTRQWSNDSIIRLKWPLDSSFTADFKVRTFQRVSYLLILIYCGFRRVTGLNFVRLAPSKLTAEGQIYICIFNRFCKALASLVIICPKTFLQEFVDHPSNIQRPAA